MANDWVIVGPTGLTSKNDFLPHVRSGDLTHEAMELVSDPRIEIYGNQPLLQVE